jgi:hypothetical protein
MPALNRIQMFFHCRACAREKPRTVSPSQYARLDIGLTPDGLQVWCTRHNREVGTFTPEQLTALLEQQPRCECCPDGKHSS